MNPTLNARGGMNRQSAREAAGLTASGSTGQTGALEIPTISPITPESLQTPVTPVTIPKPSSSAQSYMDSLAASSSSTTDLTTAEQQLNQKAQQSQNLSDLAFEDRINYMLNAPTKEAITAEQYAASGVDKKAALATSYGTQILAEQKALNNQVKEIEKNAEGRTAQGITIETNKAKSESLSRQADLAILQKVAIDDYTAAKTEADRYIDAKYSLVERNLDIFDEIYQKYEATATKDEARAFEEAQFNRRQQAQDARDAEKTLQSVKLDAMRMAQANGAPASIVASIQNAKTPEDVLNLGGQWGSVDMLEQQYKRIRNATAAKEYDQLLLELSGEGDAALSPEDRSKVAGMKQSQDAQTLITLNANLARLKNLYLTYGSYNPFNRDAARRIAALRSQLEIDIAVAGGQGAISEQEADRYKSIVGGGTWQKGSKIASSIDEAMKTNDVKISNNINYVKSAIPGAVAFEPFTDFLTQRSADDYVDSQINAGIPVSDTEAIDYYLSSFSQ